MLCYVGTELVTQGRKAQRSLPGLQSVFSFLHWRLLNCGYGAKSLRFRYALVMGWTALEIPLHVLVKTHSMCEVQNIYIVPVPSSGCNICLRSIVRTQVLMC
jgi:hypothetical protein